MQVKNEETIFNCKGLKTGSVLSLDSATKLLDFKFDTNSFRVKVNDGLELKPAIVYQHL